MSIDGKIRATVPAKFIVEILFMKCRLCGNSTKQFLSLGETPLPEEFRTKKQLNNPLKTYPLGLSCCSTCGHVQLTTMVKPDIIYKQNYAYDYSITQTGKDHWQSLAGSLSKKFRLSKNDLVIDIGSNTGILLSIFQKIPARILGIDPSPELASIALKNHIPTIVEYFSPDIAQNILKNNGRAKIITCTNVFDHVENLHEWAEGVKTLLDPSGVAIIEVPYFPNFLKKLNHIIYHQQIDYMALRPLIPFFEKHELFIADAELISFHGGSIRLYISTKNPLKNTDRMTKILKDEERYFQNQANVLKQFAQSIRAQKKSLKDLLQSLKKQHASIAAAGASAKGITLLNYCGIGADTIDFITDKSSLKIGKYTPSGIPIKSDREIFEKQPDYILLLAWNFADEIINNLIGYRGKYILPVPKTKLL